MTSELPQSRAEAKERNLPLYFTGKPCVHGHIEPRRTVNGSCLPCEQEAGRSPSHRTHTAKKIEQVRAELRRLKDRPCMDCEESYPWYVMQFDHREGTTAERKGRLASKVCSLRALRLEVARCDIICANCHAIRTHNRAVAAGQRYQH